MTPLAKGRLCARPAETADERAAVFALRALCFRGDGTRDDRDGFDAACTHVLIEDRDSAMVVGCFRLAQHRGADILNSYCAQFYDLSALSRFPAPVLELGRFCIHPQCQDGDILRLAWGALTQVVDHDGVGLLCGCTSFAGCDPAPYGDVFAVLNARHRAPAALAPGVTAPEIVSFAGLPVPNGGAAAMKAMPPLLRTYLSMGGWVSDHAVIDRSLGTLHVFTGLDIGQVPEGRARLLRAVAG